MRKFSGFLILFVATSIYADACMKGGTAVPEWVCKVPAEQDGIVYSIALGEDKERAFLSGICDLALQYDTKLKEKFEQFQGMDSNATKVPTDVTKQLASRAFGRQTKVTAKFETFTSKGDDGLGKVTEKICKVITKGWVGNREFKRITGSSSADQKEYVDRFQEDKYTAKDVRGMKAESFFRQTTVDDNTTVDAVYTRIFQWDAFVAALHMDGIYIVDQAQVKDTTYLLLAYNTTVGAYGEWQRKKDEENSKLWKEFQKEEALKALEEEFGPDQSKP